MTRKTRKPDDKGKPDGNFGTEHSPRTLGESSICTPKTGKGEEAGCNEILRKHAFIEIDGKQCEKRLIGALDDENWEVRLEALRSLEKIGSTSAIPEMVKALGDSEYCVRHAASKILEGMGEASVPHLTKGLKDNNPIVAKCSRALLKKMIKDLEGDGEASDREEGLRDAIIFSKKKITSFEELKDIISCCPLDGVDIVEGGQIFIEACRLGHIDVVSFMLESTSEDYSYTSCREGDEALVPPAIFASDDEDAAKMYDLEIPINRKGRKRNDALAVAVENGFPDIVSLLLKHEFDLSINCENADGQTPLISAGYNRDLEMIGLLLEEDVDVDIKDKFGSTIMSLALDSMNPAIIRKIIPYVFGHTVEDICKLARIEEKEDVVDSEEKLNADLARASVMKDIEGARKAIEAGADVDSIDTVTEKSLGGVFTPLMTASWHGHSEIVRLLLDADAQVNATSDEHCTALMLAVSCENEEIVQLLLKANADPNIYDWSVPRNQTPLDVALSKKNSNMKKMLLENGAKRYSEVVKERASEAESAVKEVRGILDDIRLDHAVLKPISDLIKMVNDM